MSFGKRLRLIRERRDYTQARLATLAGMHPTQLAHIEGDRDEPSAKNIRRLARAIDCRADYLLGLTEDTSRLSAPQSGSDTCQKT